VTIRKGASKSKPPIPVEAIRAKVRQPLAIVLGAPSDVAFVLETLVITGAVCYQMDLYPAERIRREIEAKALPARVVTSADLWDLEADFQTILYLAPRAGERSLKLDMVEQAFHILRPGGTFLVASPYAGDTFFPSQLKKVFGRVHTSASDAFTLFWCHRTGQRARRRHEVTFHARVGDGPSLEFLSRPGVFSYRQFDDGARALVECMSVEVGDSVLDLGCGCGTNGVFAGIRCGPRGSLTFVDSNVRAVALADHNARLNGLVNYRALAALDVGGLSAESFDVVLANPPYFAYESIARTFIERSHRLLRRGRRFYLVTKQPDRIFPLIFQAFGNGDVIERRGYAVIMSKKA
jgi:16S rRNA (guanine1207-N2)-methyltransferase